MIDSFSDEGRVYLWWNDVTRLPHPSKRGNRITWPRMCLHVPAHLGTRMHALREGSPRRLPRTRHRQTFVGHSLSRYELGTTKWIFIQQHYPLKSSHARKRGRKNSPGGWPDIRGRDKIQLSQSRDGTWNASSDFRSEVEAMRKRNHHWGWTWEYFWYTHQAEIGNIWVEPNQTCP